ncbi:MAG: UDP-N-acetylglucosamine 1-carboxyvinyltransferase, partial [Bacteroidales bacterium]|nr:UDP-N-acetylglucosamine 1-carboxyvinyltransferase [Bacteroidales bacterium]
MATFEIAGGKRLKGEITPQGAKNEALQILCAVLLTPEKVTIKNIPNIRDVNKLIELIELMGVEVNRLSTSECTFRAKNVDLEYLKTDEFKAKAAALRGSIMIVGPMLGRFGVGYIPQPGGDKIGRRRVDTHFVGFQNLGATFTFNQKQSFYEVKGDNLKGAYMLLDEA